MKTIVFKWSNTVFTGSIVEQIKSSILGQKTVIKTTSPVIQDFTLYGKCSIGNCGPFTVIDIIDCPEVAENEDYNSESEVEASLYHEACGDR